MDELKKIRAERKSLKEEFSSLFNPISELLFRHDPIHINFGHNTDEYEPEVRTILPRLKGCQSEKEVQVIVYEEFLRWFGSENAGVEDNYEKIAQDIWKLLEETNAFSK